VLRPGPAAAGLVVLTLGLAGCGGTDPEVGRSGGNRVQMTGVQPAVQELVFSGIRGTRTIPTQSLTLTNTDGKPRDVSAAAVSGPDATDFVVTGLEQPVTLQPKQTLTLTIRFTPAADAIGPLAAALAITTSAAPVTVGLHGLSTRGLEGAKEPTLADVLTTLGHPVDVGGDQLILGTADAPLGAEVRAPLFVKAGSGPVTMVPIARYSPDESLPYGYYRPGASLVQTVLGTIDPGQYQTLDPTFTGGRTFDPGAAAFGLYVHSNSFGRDTFTQSQLNTSIPHGTRVFPMHDRAGALVPDAYVVAFEDATNGDYQDYVFAVSNVRPVV
jgi:hypothetical protein